MFLSVNMTKYEFIELTNSFYNMLALERSELNFVKEYIISCIDPDKTLGEKRLQQLGHIYMYEEANIIKDYVESIDEFSCETVIGVPVHTVNFLKQFANKKNKSFILEYINKIINTANELNIVYNVTNYKYVDLKTLCNNFGYDTNWKLL